MQQRRLPAGDRVTLLRLMSDAYYQHTKLGCCFSPAAQLHSQRFYRLAAAYLRQPLLCVMMEGMRLQPGTCSEGGGDSRVGRTPGCLPG